MIWDSWIVLINLFKLVYLPSFVLSGRVRSGIFDGGSIITVLLRSHGVCRANGRSKALVNL